MTWQKVRNDVVPAQKCYNPSAMEIIASGREAARADQSPTGACAAVGSCSARRFFFGVSLSATT